VRAVRGGARAEELCEISVEAERGRAFNDACWRMTEGQPEFLIGRRSCAPSDGEGWEHGRKGNAAQDRKDTRQRRSESEVEVRMIGKVERPKKTDSP